MAVDMFLELDGIKGETQDKDFSAKSAIDILAWSWGLSNSGTAHLGGGAGAGKANFQDISITKYIDKASPTLMQFGSNGKHVAKATLSVRKSSGGAKPLTYLVITFNEVIITSYSTGGSGGEDRLTENVSLNFAKVDVKYTPQKADGTADAAVPFTWNIVTNAAS